MSASPVVGTLSSAQSSELRNQWRSLRRAATIVALLSSPALFVWLYKMQDKTLVWSLLLTVLAIAAFAPPALVSRIRCIGGST